MSGIICKVRIHVSYIYSPLVITGVAGFITLRGEEVRGLVKFFAAFTADIPVRGVILRPFTAALMTCIGNIATCLTRFITAVREGVLLMTDTAATIRTACPVIKTVMIPVCTQSMFSCCLCVAVITYFLMQLFVDIREICVCMDTGGRNSLSAFRTTIITGDRLASIFTAGCLFDHFAGLPLVIT
jgi:hypothetical protein